MPDRRLLLQVTKQRKTGRQKKIKYESFVMVLGRFSIYHHLRNYLKFALIKLFPLCILYYVTELKICEGLSKFHSYLKL